MLVLLLATLLSCSLAEDCFDYDTDYYGNDVSEGQYTPVASPEDCMSDCQASPGCEYWTWDRNYHGACWHKTAKDKRPSPGLVSGPRSCGPQTTLGPGDQQHLRILSYNMFAWNAIEQNPWKAENMYKAIRHSNPDLMGAQEIGDHAFTVVTHLSEDYKVAGETSAGHAILYRESALTLEEWSIAELEQTDQWGLRMVEWAKFTHKATGRQVDHFNTHLCVCDGWELLGSAKTIAATILANRRPGSILILTGDFNVMSDDYENSKAVRYLTGDFEDSPVVFVDTFRVANGDGEDGSTFPGLGKIDYILTEAENVVTSAWIDRGNYGEASDHLPISAVLHM